MFKSAVAHAQDPTAIAPAAGGGMGMFGSMLPLIAIFAVMWFFMSMPQQRREMLASIAKGDRVVTNGGICGTIVGLHEKTVVLKVSDDPPTKIEFVRSAISQVTKE